MTFKTPYLIKKLFTSIFVLTLLAFVTSCSSSKIQTKKNTHKSYSTKSNSNTTKGNTTSKGKSFKKNAIASYYHDKFNGRSTANGEKFNNNKLTAAHKTLALGTVVRVTNVVNSKSVVVTINDRGPFTKGREIDLSKKAFFEISDKTTHGTLNVNIEILN